MSREEIAMKRIGRILLIALPALVVGLVCGAIGGITLYESANGGLPENIASQATTAAYLLRSRTEKSAATDAVVAQQLADEANRNLALASSLYANLQVHFRTALDKAARVLEDDPRSSYEVDADANRQYARAARACILAGGEPAAVQDCARRSSEEIRDRYCETIGNLKHCRFPSTWSDPLKIAAAAGNPHE